MFPRLRETIGTALDIVVEFSTLGEYRLAASSAPGTASALAAVPESAPRRGGIGSSLTGVAVERIVAGGAVASRSESLRTPAATPAARRLQGPSPCDGGSGASTSSGTPEHRSERSASAAASDANASTQHRALRSGSTGTLDRCRGARAPSAKDAAVVTRRARSGAPTVAEQLCFASV